MRKLMTILLMLATYAAAACVCHGAGPLSVKEVEGIQYIALVKITNIGPLNEKSFDRNDSGFFTIGVKEIVHYKGGAFSNIIVAGGNIQLGNNTSCDYGMAVGEEWLVFADDRSGKAVVYTCSRTIRYRDAEGLRDWEHGKGVKEIGLLNDHFNRNANAVKARSLITRYGNGRPEKVEQYKRGKLHGIVEYFYPDGRKFGKEEYRNGRLHGRSEWFFHNGDISTRLNFSKGIPVDSAARYINTSSGSQPFMIHIFDKKGILIKSLSYSGAHKRFLYSEEIFEPFLNKRTYIIYHESGKVRATGQQVNGKDTGEYKEYDEQGRLLRSWKYDENGKVIK